MWMRWMHAVVSQHWVDIWIWDGKCRNLCSIRLLVQAVPIAVAWDDSWILVAVSWALSIIPLFPVCMRLLYPPSSHTRMHVSVTSICASCLAIHGVILCMFAETFFYARVGVIACPSFPLIKERWWRNFLPCSPRVLAVWTTSCQ